MEDVKLIREEENDFYQKILFERPISRLQARKIGVLAGKHAQLKRINDIYQIVLAMNHDIIFVAEEELKSAGVPADIFLYGGKKGTLPFENTDEAIHTLQDCSYIAVGMDIEISSRLQIFLEKLVNSRQAPIVFTSESVNLFKITPSLALKRKGDIFICNTKKLVELANYLHLPVNFTSNAGIYNKINLLKQLAEFLQANIICIENYQVISCSYTSLHQAGIINLNNSDDISIDYLYIPILLSLLCDVTNPEFDMLKRILTAGYLLRKSLVDKNSFFQNLAHALQEK